VVHRELTAYGRSLFDTAWDSALCGTRPLKFGVWRKPLSAFPWYIRAMTSLRIRVRPGERSREGPEGLRGYRALQLPRISLSLVVDREL